MYYYTFNIGDYVTSTHHLDEMEDLAYRRMIDLYYSKESPLPKNKADIAKRIRMQTHSECIANVLQEFFTLEPDGYHHERIDKDLEAYKTKSSKAKRAANARWNKNNDLEDANASTKQSECNADGMPTNNHKPITNNQNKKKKEVSQKLDFSSWPSAPSEQVFKDWKSLRTKLKAPISQTVINRLAKQLIAAAALGYSVDDCLAECTVRGWRGFEAEWLKKTPAANQPQQQLISGNPYEN